MTDKPIEELVTVARSWSQPPKIIVQSQGFMSNGYDRSERAYQIECADPTSASVLRCQLAANLESPVYNIPMIITDWGDTGATLKINGKSVDQGRDFRVGHRYRLEHTDLIVWIKLRSTEPVSLELSPINTAP
jgi:hypothetical protein